MVLRVKASLNLPDPLLRSASAPAAQRGRPLRDFVAEAFDERIAVLASEVTEERREAWQQWCAQLVQLPDGSWSNHDGIRNETSSEALDQRSAVNKV
jgi:hypothetical protein